MFLPLLAMALQAPLILPANTAYVTGPANDASLDDRGTIEKWRDPKTQIMWGGYLVNAGDLNIKLAVTQGSGSTYDINVNGVHRQGHAAADGSVDFGKFRVDKPEWVTLILSGKSAGDQGFGQVSALNLSGDASQQAKFNLKERRNAASVHIRYDAPATPPIAWFYNEVRPKTDPINTFYMACGFRRGYFGMQVNSPTNRRIIFSVWDSGNESTDRSKVADKDKVQLLAKGDGVDAGSFGNEGTGGHSHLNYMWKTNEVHKFLLHAVPEGETTVYSAYYYFNDRKKWGLIASFRAPKDGQSLSGMHSFIEDFWGDNGQLLRQAQYGPVWVKSETGPWSNINHAKFSHDGTGGKDRFDYDFLPKENGFLLQNGGFTGASPKYGAEIETKPATTPPGDPKDLLGLG